MKITWYIISNIEIWDDVSKRMMQMTRFKPLIVFDASLALVIGMIAWKGVANLSNKKKYK